MPKPVISALAEAVWYPEAQFTITGFISTTIVFMEYAV